MAKLMPVACAINLAIWTILELEASVCWFKGFLTLNCRFLWTHVVPRSNSLLAQNDHNIAKKVMNLKRSTWL